MNNEIDEETGEIIEVKNKSYKFRIVIDKNGDVENLLISRVKDGVPIFSILNRYVANDFISLMVNMAEIFNARGIK